MRLDAIQDGDAPLQEEAAGVQAARLWLQRRAPQPGDEHREALGVVLVGAQRAAGGPRGRVQAQPAGAGAQGQQERGQAGHGLSFFFFFVCLLTVVNRGFAGGQVKAQEQLLDGPKDACDHLDDEYAQVAHMRRVRFHGQEAQRHCQAGDVHALHFWERQNLCHHARSLLLGAPNEEEVVIHIGVSHDVLAGQRAQRATPRQHQASPVPQQQLAHHAGQRRGCLQGHRPARRLGGVHGVDAVIVVQPAAASHIARAFHQALVFFVIVSVRLVVCVS